MMTCAFLLTGCSRSPRQDAVHIRGARGPSILDEPLRQEIVRKRVTEAEQDFPTDTWKTTTGGMAQHWNQSRRERELKISGELLAELEPKLKQMSVPQLLDSIKTWPNSGPGRIDGVSYSLYVEGNHAILRELKQRPSGDLEYLREFQGNSTFIFESDQGPKPMFGQFCSEVLIERGLAR